MHIIKLDAIDSTNTYLKDLALREHVDDDTVVYTQNQHKGRGQLGNQWESEKGKNLTFSILKKFTNLRVSQKVWVNSLVALAIIEVLQGMAVPKLAIKWPNDIMSGNQKICGILIENVLQGSHIKHTIIGIGLNVNQTVFEGLPKASSLQLLLERPILLDPLLLELAKTISLRLKEVARIPWDKLKGNYERVLYRKDIITAFEDAHGLKFMGIIRTIDQHGKLWIAHEDGQMKSYGLKEIKLLG